jgi:DNA-binding HxlR family transcriptional regulator
MQITYQGKSYGCAMEMTFDLIGGKWKALILWHLAEEKTLRFGELKRLFPKVTQKMLTQQLRELERDGLIGRKVYACVPPRVEYSINEVGLSLFPALTALNGWGLGFVTTPSFAAHGSIEADLTCPTAAASAVTATATAAKATAAAAGTVAARTSAPASAR